MKRMPLEISSNMRRTTSIMGYQQQLQQQNQQQQYRLISRCWHMCCCLLGGGERGRGGAANAGWSSMWYPSIPLTLLIFILVLWQNHELSFLDGTVKWNPALMHHNTSACQSTLFQPFRVGCPSSCASRRNDGVDENTETMYRMNIGWYFGEPSAFTISSDDEPPQDLSFPEPPTAYDKGINFQSINPSFVDTFVRASNYLQEHTTSSFSDLIYKPQKRMHLTLAYLCCLRQNETDWVREIMYDWMLNHRPFDIPVQFTNVQCWKERFDSVTNILLVDEKSQRHLLRTLRTLERALTLAGIPIAVPREDQMPFHVTLGGLHYGEDSDSKDGKASEHDIDPALPMVHTVVGEVNELYPPERWNGGGRGFIRIAHDPRYSQKGVIHSAATEDNE